MTIVFLSMLLLCQLNTKAFHFQSGYSYVIRSHKCSHCHIGQAIFTSDLWHFGAGQNWRRPKSVQVNIGAEKNEPTWLYSALIKKNSCAKLIVLRLMITCYIGNMIVFLRWHYAHLSIPFTSTLSALNHNKILFYCNCHGMISRSVHMFAFFFASCENKLSHYKWSRDLRCITPGIVQCRLCENTTLLAIKQLHKITFY